MTEFLLAELSRTMPAGHSGNHGNGADACETRETVALAAAWSLGMVTAVINVDRLLLYFICVHFWRFSWEKAIKGTVSMTTLELNQRCKVWWT